MKKTNTTINTIGCDNLVDNTFVPEAGTAGNRGSNNSEKLRADAGMAPTLGIADLFSKGYKVNAQYAGTPKDGMHYVIINGEPSVRKGNNGAYAEIELKEITADGDFGLCWKTFVTAENLPKMLEDINYYNSGIISKLSGMNAIARLYKTDFAVWTIKSEKDSNKVYTYFNKAKYDKRLYAMSLEAERKEEKMQRNKERADNEARMAEEAKMGRENKSPWED